MLARKVGTSSVILPKNSHNGSELIAKVLDLLAYENQVSSDFSRPGETHGRSDLSPDTGTTARGKSGLHYEYRKNNLPFPQIL